MTFNAALLGVESYSKAAGLLAELADLGIFVDLQVQADQIADMLPLLEATDVRVVVDHCGRPRPGAGLDQPGFAALFGAATGRVFVKIRGTQVPGSVLILYREQPRDVQSLLQPLRAELLRVGFDGRSRRARSGHRTTSISLTSCD